MEHVVGIKNPRVGIVNIGVEEKKRARQRDVSASERNPYINFVGSIEAREIQTEPQTLLSEAFVGNVILSCMRASARPDFKVKQGMMTSLRSKIEPFL